MQIIILSFTSALDCMADGTLSDDDLGNAIFVLGCTRSFVLETESREILKIQTPHQKKSVGLDHITKFAKHLEDAEKSKRVMWRRLPDGNGIPSHHIQNQLSSLLKSRQLEPLNPNLPPCDENSFLKTAIEQVNNKNGARCVKVVT